ncbi:MAG TPA: rod shape-determining protein MreD, partial [Longimicrobiales bacterium]|nr:rod shape-determining protein MreD [Longimicrobiales bacterium]
LTVAVLLGARRTRPGVGAGVGFVFGLIRDALGLGPFGTAALVLTALGYLGSRTRDLFEGESLLFTLVYLFVGVWLHNAAYTLIGGELLAGGLGMLFVVGAAAAAGYAALAGTVLLFGYRVTLATR